MDEATQFELVVYLHMLSHATGFKLANDGQGTRAIQHSLGHKNTPYTVFCTTLAATRVQAYWDD